MGSTLAKFSGLEVGIGAALVSEEVGCGRGVCPTCRALVLPSVGRGATWCWCGRTPPPPTADLVGVRW